jgi:hypothetical protein
MARFCVPNYFMRDQEESKGGVAMIDHRDSSTKEIDEPPLNLLPPRFDEEASANAQPVQPIPASRINALRNRLGSVRRRFGNRFSAFVLVVIGGLMTGALGGVAWVKVDQLTDVSSVASESMSEASVSSNLLPEEPGAAVAGIQEMRIVPENRIRKRSARLGSRRAARAYLFDILRR